MGGVLAVILLLSFGIVLVGLVVGLVVIGLMELSPKGVRRFQENASDTSSDDEFSEFLEEIRKSRLFEPNELDQWYHHHDPSMPGNLGCFREVEIHYADSDK